MKVCGLKLWVSKSAPLVAGALAIGASAAAFGNEDTPETIRQVSTTQAHLQAMQPVVAPRKAVAPTLARLAGKLLSEQVPGLHIELDTAAQPEQSAGPALNDRSTLHFNRRAEICFDNYRVGLQRKGLMMRYEVSF
jgi:hypothetical protein